MSKRRGFIAFGLCLIAGIVLFGAVRSAPNLAEADRLYADRSYAKALESYQQVLEAGQAGERRVEIEYRVTVCLGRSQRWDDALEKTAEFVKAHPAGLWGARGQYWQGQLLVVVPHSGYRVGKRVYRGEDYPKVEGAEKPERVNLGGEDIDGARASFEQAKRLYEKVSPRVEREEADLNFDLARLLSGRDLSLVMRALLTLEKQKHPALRINYAEVEPAEAEKLRNHDWTPTPDKPYDSKQPLPQRILGLYEQIERLDGGRRTPQARLAKALYLERYQSQMRNAMRGYDQKEKRWIEFPFPYQQIDTIALLQSIPDDFPKHAIAPQVQLTVGQRWEGKQEFVKALAVYRRLVQDWPQSQWVSDAQGKIQNIEWPSVNLNAKIQHPGEKVMLNLNGRNVKTVSLTAYRVRLEEILLRPEVLNAARIEWSNFGEVFGREPNERWRSGKKVASWTYVTGDTGEHKQLSGQVTAPLEDIGAYVVEASSGDAHAACLVLITDLAIVQKSDRDQALAYVCDAKSGGPVPGADVVVRERYWRGNTWFVDVTRGRSDPKGIETKDLVRGPGRVRNQIETLAWVGERYAVTPNLGSGSGGRDNRDEYRAYTYTDRPVYRPGQSVNFRAILTFRSAANVETEAGRYEPARNLETLVTVRDPKNEEVYHGTLTTNEFGSVNGSFMLGSEPPLGNYRIKVRIPSKSEASVTEAGGNRFRVEEYKKPEFEVKVTPAAEQGRVGDTVKAAINAKYYFGSPVVGAKVAYRVFRAPYYPRYRFPRPYDWLMRYWRQGDYHRGYGRGDVVKEGEGRTDAKGDLEIDFETAEEGRWAGARAFTYTVEAEVTDASRRTITGAGEVRVSRQQFFAFLDIKRGFFQVNDRIEVEVATRDVMDRPVAAAGLMLVQRVVKGAPDLVEELVYKESVATDKEGRAFFHWTVKQAGQYRFVFEARDGWEQKVTAGIYTWVHGPDFDKAAFRLQGILLVPDKQTYDEGETCRLLIVSSLPDATVLLTQQAGNQILARDVLPIRGKSRVVEVALNRGHMPNFHFYATAVRDWRAYRNSTEVFVPPGKQFLEISVASDKAEYRPGEKATFRLKALDWRGQPARAELSVGVVDASVFYIQKEFAPDPRLFFYSERRSSNVRENWSFQRSGGGASVTTRTQVPYKRHQWVMPEDMGQLQDWPPGSVGWDYWGYGRYGGGEYLRRGGFVTFGSAGPMGPAGEMQGAPMPASAPMLGDMSMGLAGGGYAANGIVHEKAQVGGAEAPLAEAQVRSQFADTAFWSPAVVTDADGTATVTVTMPENLTTWRTTTRGLTTDVQVGQATSDCVTRKNLIVRLQAPRFFMERDLVVLSANVHNYLATEKRAKVQLTLDGGVLEVVKAPAELGLQNPAAEASLWVTVPKDGEQRVDWVVRVLRSGTASVRMTAQTDEESDAVQMEFPALVHGAEKFVVQSGVMRDVDGSRTTTLTLDVPKERQRGATELNLQLTPSLAATMLDALPYLADYPYGCIEQTMSRFLPSVLVARTLTDLGVNLDELSKRAQAYESELKASAGSQARPDSAYTYPKGMPGSINVDELSSRMYLRRGHNPIFDPAQLKAMVKEGLARIYSFQHGDGGWGWWQNDISDPYMTAYVCYGLFTAREAGWDIKDDVLERGFQFLIKAMKEDDNLHRVAYLASVVTLRGSVDDAVKTIISDRLYRNRMKLTPYSQALLALALKQIGDLDEARVLVDNLENTANIDRENGTCNWRPRQRGWWWWHWWDNPVETNAAVLRAYLAIRPDSDLAPMMVKWMVNNRRGNHWQSTKETAMAVYALADFIRVKKELAPDYTITVDFGGRVQRTYRVNRDNALFFDNRFIIGDEVIGDGAQPLTITVKGTGTLYYTAYLKYFSREEDLKGAGNEIFVERRYFKLTPRLVNHTEGKRTWQELTYDRSELKSRAWLRSGDLVEVELVLEAKNDYEYLVFEDMKPAGCEPVEVRSGTGEGAGVYSYMELRDEKVAFFISHMPQGRRAVRYRVRAEIPGQFHALPTNGYSMYAPDVRCLGNEWRVNISD